MYEATFSIDDQSPYTRATRETDCRISLWCNDYCDLLHISGSDFSRVLDQVRTDVGIGETLRSDEEIVVITETCLKEHNSQYIEQYLREYQCLLLPPLQYENGHKQCRILSLNPNSLSGVYQSLVQDRFTVDVLSKHELQGFTETTSLLMPDSIIPHLTERQREVLLTAVENGYYGLPRETTTEEISDTVGISRRTTEDHLRRAEQKLITSLVDYLF